MGITKSNKLDTTARRNTSSPRIKINSNPTQTLVKERVNLSVLRNLELDSGNGRVMFGAEWVKDTHSATFLSKVTQHRELGDGLEGEYFSFYSDGKQTYFNLIREHLDKETCTHYFKIISIINEHFFYDRQQDITKYLTHFINYGLNNRLRKTANVKLITD